MSPVEKQNQVGGDSFLHAKFKQVRLVKWSHKNFHCDLFYFNAFIVLVYLFKNVKSNLKFNHSKLKAIQTEMSVRRVSCMDMGPPTRAHIHSDMGKFMVLILIWALISLMFSQMPIRIIHSVGKIRVSYVHYKFSVKCARPTDFVLWYITVARKFILSGRWLVVCFCWCI